MNENTKKLFHKLVELNKRAPAVLATVSRLAADAGRFSSAMSAVEGWLAERRAAEKEARESAVAKGPGVKPAVRDVPPPLSPVAALTTDEWVKFCREIGNSPPLSALFGSESWRFSDAAPRDVATLAGLADVAPGRGGALYTEDAAFMSVLELTHSERVESARRLLVSTVASLIKLIYTQRAVALKLYEVAATPHWRSVMKMLETGRRVGGGEEGGAVTLYGEILRDLPPDSRQMLFGDVYLARLTPPALFRLAWESQAAFDAARSTQAPELESSTGRWSYQAEAALTHLWADASAAEILSGFEAEMGLRLEVVRHLLDLRQTVKRDALVHEWPEAALLAMSNFESLKEVESLVFGHTRDTLPPQPATFLHEESYDLYELCKADERLVSYLRLLPRFSEMDIANFAGGAAAASMLREAASRAAAPRHHQAQPTPHAAGHPPVTTVVKTDRDERTEKDEKAPGVETPPDSSADPRAQAPEKPSGERVEATLHVLSPVGGGEQTGQENVYEFGLSLQGRETDLREIEFPTSETMMDLLRALKIPAVGETHRYVAEVFRRPNSMQRVTLAGKRLFDWLEAKVYQWKGEEVMRDASIRRIWPPEWTEFHALLAAARGGETRLTVNTDILGFAALPWEWLVFPEYNLSFPLNAGCSLVRDTNSSPDVLGLFPPLRVMALAAGPNEQSHVQAAKRASVLLKTISTQYVELAFSLIDKPVSAEAFSGELRSFSPQVLYLDTHILARDREPVPYLALSANEGVPVSELGRIIRDAEVQFVVFGDNPTGVFGPNLLLECVIELMKAGLPAALAPTRFVEEGTSVNFLRNFFGAWLSSQTLEASVSSAREALRNGRGDWSAYALFAGREALERLRL